MFKNKTKNDKNFKKLPCKKLFAFTLAEILLVFAFIGVISVAYAVDSRSKIETTQKKLLVYNLFKTLDLASNEIARTNNDVVPDNGETFCNKLAELFNTVGEVNCSSSLTSFGTNFFTPNFVTSNGMSFYNVSATPTADISDASKLISTQEYQIIHEQATNKAKSEVTAVMNTIRANAEAKARAKLPARNYAVNAIYTKFEIGTPSLVTNENGSYEVHQYNYNIDFEHDGKAIPVQKQAYSENATCYDIINVLNPILEEEMANATMCSSVKASYTETFSVNQKSDYANIKNIIDQNYTEKEGETVRAEVEEATSEGVKKQEEDKLYQKYYNQYFQAKYTEKATSLPTVHNIYVDINGKRGKSVLNEDVFLFLVRSDGKTIPSKVSDLSNKTNIISAGYYAKNNNPILTGITFREAACRTAKFSEADYSTNGYCQGYAVDSAHCPRKNACYYKITQPKSMWSLF